MSFKVKWENEEQLKGMKEPQLREALKERSDMLATVMAEAKTDEGSYDHSTVKVREFKDSAELATFMKNVNDELSVVGEAIEPFDELAMVAKSVDRWQGYQEAHEAMEKSSAWAPGSKKSDEKPQAKSIGEALNDDVFTAAKNHEQGRVVVEEFDAKAWLEQKTVFSTSAGWAPESLRTGRVVMDAQREIEVTDILPAFPTTQAVIKYMEETTFTNAAAERNEGAAYAESALALTERSQTVRSVGTSLPVTDEQLEDEAGVRAYLDQRLGFMVRQRVTARSSAATVRRPTWRAR